MPEKNNNHCLFILLDELCNASCCHRKCKMIHKMSGKAKPNKGRQKASFVTSSPDLAPCHADCQSSVTNLTRLIWHQLQCRSRTHGQDEGSDGDTPTDTYSGEREEGRQLTSGTWKDETAVMMDAGYFKPDRWLLQLRHLTFNSHNKEEQRKGSREKIKIQKTRTHRTDMWSNEEGGGKKEISILVNKA